MTDVEKIYAVLTGDLVKSSRLTSIKSRSAMERLKKITTEFAEQHPNSVVGRMDTFRHDSWQLLLERPAHALRTAVFLRTALKLQSDASTKYDGGVCPDWIAVEFFHRHSPVCCHEVGYGTLRFFTSPDSSMNQRFAKDYYDRFSEYPDYMAGETYAGVYFIKAAIERAGTAEADKIIEAPRRKRAGYQICTYTSPLSELMRLSIELIQT